MKLFVFALLALVAAASAHDFTKCGNVHKLDIQDLNLYPDPVVAGKSLEVVFSGSATEQITGGTATLKVSVFGVTIITENFDVCKLNITCPIPAGPFTASLPFDVPSSAPAMTAQAEVSVTDTSGSDLECIDMNLKISTRAASNEASTLERKELEFLFEAWRLSFEKEFNTPEEYIVAMETFAINHMFITEHNAGDHTYTMAHNEFSHISWEEFRLTHLGFGNVPQKKFGNAVNNFADVDISSLPASVDWEAAGAVTPVKNQGQCGSCWSFSTTGALEGAYQIKTGNLVSFSEQELVDCDSTDSGCNGGLMTNAFDWIIKNGGLCSESDYPYSAQDGTCKKDQCTSVPGSAPKSYTNVGTSESAMQAAVAQQPVAIAIEADQMGFQFYSSGVFTGSCGTNLDHGVLNVGYGTMNGVNYWKVKNSWGSSWGSNGYINLQRGNSQYGGQCGLLLMASYANM